MELSIDCQAIDEACDIVWNVSPAANEYNNSAGNCDACSPTTDIFEDVVFPGILGTVVRTITVTPQLQCVDSVDLGLIEVLPTPEVSWVDDVSLALACFDDNTTSLAVEYTGSNQSPDLVTWDLTNNANNAMWSWVDVVNGGNFSELTFADIDWDALGVDGSQSGSLNVAVSVVDATGCASDTLGGLIQYFGVPSPDGIVFDPVCEGEDLQPMNVPVGGLEYEWYVNSTDVNPLFEDAFPVFSDLTCGKSSCTSTPSTCWRPVTSWSAGRTSPSLTCKSSRSRNPYSPSMEETPSARATTLNSHHGCIQRLRRLFF